MGFFSLAKVGNFGIYSETSCFIEGWQFCGSINESQTIREGGFIAAIFLEVEWSRYWAWVSYVANMDWRLFMTFGVANIILLFGSNARSLNFLFLSFCK